MNWLLAPKNAIYTKKGSKLRIYRIPATKSGVSQITETPLHGGSSEPM
jgi:hypothetical protein